jgi:hypothetical protein
MLTSGEVLIVYEDLVDEEAKEWEQWQSYMSKSMQTPASSPRKSKINLPPRQGSPFP